MKKIMNHIGELFMRCILGKKEAIDGRSWIQKRILNNRYYGKKKYKLNVSQPITKYPSFATSLIKNNNTSVVSFKLVKPGLIKIG
tara:strand:- start:361 stop:615 length:255 start_codon:yes stop_codon:yes gene_type:complete